VGNRLHEVSFSGQIAFRAGSDTRVQPTFSAPFLWGLKKRPSDATVSKYFMSIWPNSISAPTSRQGGRADDNSERQGVIPRHSFFWILCALRVSIAILFMKKGKSPKRLRELSLSSQLTLPFCFLAGRHKTFPNIFLKEAQLIQIWAEFVHLDWELKKEKGGLFSSRAFFSSSLGRIMPN